MPRKRLTKAQKAVILDRQEHRCATCGEEFIGHIEYDHVIPLALGGEDGPDNMEAKCKSPCHSQKTKSDVKNIARAKRRQRFMQEGRHRKRKGRPMQSRGFSKTYKRKLDGRVVKNE